MMDIHFINKRRTGRGSLTNPGHLSHGAGQVVFSIPRHHNTASDLLECGGLAHALDRLLLGERPLGDKDRNYLSTSAARDGWLSWNLRKLAH